MSGSGLLLIFMMDASLGGQMWCFWVCGCYKQVFISGLVGSFCYIVYLVCSDVLSTSVVSIIQEVSGVMGGGFGGLGVVA